MPWMINNVLKQSQAQSCGYCCVGMVLKMVNDQNSSEESLVAKGREVGGSGAYDRATKDMVGVQQTMLVDAAQQQQGKVANWGSGTYGDHLQAVLESYNLNATYHEGQGESQRKRIMRTATGTNPVIVLVQWTSGGGHWVVVSGRATRLGRASQYTIMDPGADNLVVNMGSDFYQPPYNALGSGGKFAGYLITIQGPIKHLRGPKMP